MANQPGSDTQSTQALKQLPLHAAHTALGAKMAPFAGYEMPVQYPPGMLKEHLHVRAAAGLFDVSHMGQIVLRAKSGRIAEVAKALETLTPADIIGLAPGRQRYALLTNEAGGILDDFMVANLYDYDQSGLYLVVNASRKDADLAHLRARLSAVCEVELNDRALLALQGPRASEVLDQFAPASAGLKFMDAAELRILDQPCLVTRSGYTGEDGFEISVDSAAVGEVWTALLTGGDVMPIGLAARDSLRLEAGLCLYGNDIDETTTPVEAALEWAMGKQRRPGGARAGGFPGAARVFDQLKNGTARRRVGLLPDKRPARAGAALFANEASPTQVGVVTSGGFGATLNAPVSMAYVDAKLARLGQPLSTDIGGKRYAAQVAAMPFVAHHYRK